MVTSENQSISLALTFRQVRDFLRRPEDQPLTGLSRGDKWKRLFHVFLLDLLGSGVFILLLSVLEPLGLFDPEEHAVAQAFEELGTAGMLILAVLVAPFFEEVFFRFPLRFKRNPLAFIRRLIAGHDADKQERIHRSWDRRFPWIFYLFTTVFALIHLTNFPFSVTILLLAPILTGAQFVLGALAGVLRVQQGFLWAFALHAIHNLLFVGSAILFMSPPAIIEVNNTNYHLEVRESTAGDLDYSSYVTADSLAYSNFTLRALLIDLIEREEDEVKFDPEGFDNPRLDVTYGPDFPQRRPKMDVLNEIRGYYGIELIEGDSPEEIIVRFSPESPVLSAKE
ncbi:CPBP family intramembrane glutamic endopeptidase [Lewinella sp. W8]|uniref:CPBP family intramembrane glutamic endopeptidase n=1 Tax=Lewinella sp. W8 TaxID=2528208 RepID=UPI0010676CF8|nr:CPBP family intramembrane glutamic endopeptidase [Lewinella sp. W8]MTB49884.1 CPBP family intramembrane metalloprotease [Lewinella sp. W8]